MKEWLKNDQLHNFGVEALNSSFEVEDRYWFTYLEDARKFKEHCIETGTAPAFIRIVKVID